ncbi:MAG: TonB-dependent receptor domain-containing protein [Bryobacteraceae bacterium]
MPFRLFTSLALLWFASTAAFAQSTYGTLLGTVTDASGAVVPAATVTVTDVDTNTAKTATTNSAGEYEVPNLLPGNYDVAVTAKGFKQFVRRGVPLDPRASVRVDASLQVGAEATIVEVTGHAPVITTENATVSDVKDGREISQLPLNYRGVSTTPLNAILTIPNVQVDSGGPLGSAAISIGGNHPAQNEFTVDGFSVSSPRSNGPLQQMFPSTEAISELKVTSQLAPAEYGQVGDVSFIGKSGSNQYHGSLFEYLQNDAMDATPLFTISKPKKRANDFGGSLSGPVRLPYFNGRNHTFFLFDYERNLQRSARAIVNSVPTPAMLAGDFTGLSIVTNPFTGQPFLNNKIPTGLINPVSQKVLSTYYPAANVLKGSSPVNDFLANVPTPITTDLSDVRIDQVLSSKQSLFGRYSWKKLTAAASQSLAPQIGTYSQNLDPRSFVVSHNYSITPNLLNEFRFGYNRQTTQTAYPHFPDGSKLISDLGLQQLGPFPPGSGYPDFNFLGSTGLTSTPGGREENLREKKFQFADNLTWIKGRHTMKLGFDVRALAVADYESFTTADNFGDYYFDGRYTGSDFADFLLGLPFQTVVVNAGPDFDGHARAYSFFAQDSFKVTNKLSVDFGLRYEYHPPFHDNSLQIANFNRATGAVVVPNAKSLALSTQPFLQSINACGLATPNPTDYGLYPCTPVQTAAQAGIPESLRISDKTRFLPRLSFAYRLNERTVIRAGGGLYDETILGSIFYSLTGIQTSDYRQFNNSTPDAIKAGAAPAIQFPNTKSNSVSNGATAAGNAAFGTANQIDFRDPYGEQWSFTVERDLGWSTGLRVTYTGLRSIGLVISPDLNQIPAQAKVYDPRQKPFPNWGLIKSRDNGGHSFYNGLETVLTHRFTTGITFQSSWIWSKNLSDAEGDAPNAGFAGEAGPRLVDDYNLHNDYGNVAFTRRHRWLTTGNFELPFGRGKRFGANMNRAVDAVLGGWQTANIILWQSGPFLTPRYTGSKDPSGTDAPDRQGTQRPDRLPSAACAGLPTSQARVLQGNCFYYGWPGPIGRFGNAGVGILHGPGTVVWNTGLAKNFAITERARLRLEGTFNNILNHPNLGTFATAANSASFGTISSVQTNEGAGARTVQLGMRLDF